MSDDFECGLGDEIDEDGDPPRMWLPHAGFPGCAFSRSFGDACAEEIGCFAEPEVARLALGAADAFVVLASDGVWEFLTNQAVLDIVARFDNPVEACHAVVARAYKLWIEREGRSDDITIICVFLD